jgi:hypothetical protein
VTPINNGEEPLARTPWLAFFFDSADDSQPPVRTAVVEAENEDDAGRQATAQMGRCLRVAVARPAWVPSGAATKAREAAARGRAAPLCE